MNDTYYFIDTGALFSLILSDQLDHHHYVELFEKILYQPHIQLFTTDYVIDECFTLLRKKSTMTAEQIFNIFEKMRRGGLKIMHLDEKYFEATTRLLKKYHDHLLSFTDGTSATFMKKNKIHNVLSTDSDFRIFKFNVL